MSGPYTLFQLSAGATAPSSDISHSFITVRSHRTNPNSVISDTHYKRFHNEGILSFEVAVPGNRTFVNIPFFFLHETPSSSEEELVELKHTGVRVYMRVCVCAHLLTFRQACICQHQESSNAGCSFPSSIRTPRQ